MARSEVPSRTMLTPSALRSRGVPVAQIVRLDPARLGAAGLMNLLGLLLPLATLHVYDRVLPNQSIETLVSLTLLLLGVAGIELTLRLLQMRVTAPSAAKYARDLKHAALKRYLTARRDGKTADRTPTEFLERLSAVDRFSAFFGGAARNALIDLPFGILALGLIFLVGGPIVIAPLLILGLYLAILSVYGVTLRRRSRERQDSDTKINDFLLEVFSSILTVKSLGLERMMLRRYERLLGFATSNQEQIVIAAGSIQRISLLFSNLTIVATLTCGAVLAIQGAMTIGAVAASTLLAGRAVQPAIRAARAWSEVQRAALAAEDVAKLFSDVDATDAAGPRAAETVPAAADGAIAPPALSLASDPVNHAQGGSIIVISGGNAGARSAALRAAAGLRAPLELGSPRLADEDTEPQGSLDILLDGQPSTEFRDAFAGEIVIAPRGGVRFRGTILDNLTLFDHGASAQAVFQTSATLGLDDMMRKLPAGYDTPVAHSVEETLSAGAFKIVTITRALAQEPSLLLLDDPAVHLSAKQAQTVFNELAARRGRSTIIIAANDPRADQIADFSIHLDAEGPLLLTPAQSADAMLAKGAA